jgi:hypothetical protein
MLIGVVVLSFDASQMPSPPRVMEGRNKKKAGSVEMLRSNWNAVGKPSRGNMCSLAELCLRGCHEKQS